MIVGFICLAALFALVIVPLLTSSHGRPVNAGVRMKRGWKRWVLLLCLPLNVLGYDPLPDCDGSYGAGAGTGLRKVVSEWISDGQSRIDVVAKYGEIENWDTAELTNLAYLFESKSTFNADISKWIVSKVTNMIGSKSILPNCWYLWSFVVFSTCIHFSTS